LSAIIANRKKGGRAKPKSRIGVAGRIVPSRIGVSI